MTHQDLDFDTTSKVALEHVCHLCDPSVPARFCHTNVACCLFRYPFPYRGARMLCMCEHQRAFLRASLCCHTGTQKTHRNRLVQVCAQSAFTQKARKGCHCFPGLFRRSREKFGKTVGKFHKILPVSRSASNSRISGTRKANLAGILGRRFCAGCFSDSYSLLEFF